MTKIPEVIQLAKARAMARNGEAQAIRERNHLTISEVAREIEVSPSSVMRWEKGERSPRGDSAIRFAELMHKLDKVAP